jgi:hypothetical protein
MKAVAKFRKTSFKIKKEQYSKVSQVLSEKRRGIITVVMDG